MRNPPETVRVEVAEDLAERLFEAATSLPRHDNEDYYSVRLQAHLRDELRRRAGDGYDHVVREIRARLGRAPYFALVRGLRLDEENRLFVALNRAFGNLVAGPYRPPRAQLVHYIQPATDIAATRDTRTESERLHTDSADWPEPVEIVSMVCVRPDRGGGGRSRILDLHDLRREVAERLGDDALELLEREPVPWKLADHFGGGVAWRPVLTATSVCWRRYTIDAAVADGAALPATLADVLEPLDRTFAESGRAHEFLMGAGELLVADNHRTLHARTSISGDYPTSGRLMIRSWVRSAG